MRNTGTIRSWNEQKAFGFIQPRNGGKDVFLHISDMGNRNRTPSIGQKVSYTLSTDKQGRPCAANVLFPGDRLSVHKRKGGIAAAILVAAMFLCVVAVVVHVQTLPVWILWGYLVISLVTFLAYAFDKSAAKSGSWRTPESTLHWLSLAGGWPGALVAQQVLRHKTIKRSFRAVFWITVVFNCGVLIWICTPGGTQLLQDWRLDGIGSGNSATIEWAD